MSLAPTQQQQPFDLQGLMENRNAQSPNSAAGLYGLLHFGRFAFTFGGLMFSFGATTTPLPFLLHATLLLLTVLEAIAAARSRTSDLHKKRLWAISNIGLYFTSLLTVVACIVVRVLAGGGNDGDDWLGDQAFFIFPDIINLALVVAEFFTLPMLRIRHWRALPRDEGLVVGDSIPVIAYRDEAEEEEETGPLAEAFRAQQQSRPDHTS